MSTAGNPINSATGAWKKAKAAVNSEHPAWNHLMLRLMVENEKRGDDDRCHSLEAVAAMSPLEMLRHELVGTRIAMPFAANEYFGCQLAKVVGINSPEVLLATGQSLDWSMTNPLIDANTVYLDAWLGFGTAAYNPPTAGRGILTEDFYIKPLSGGWALVRRVPGALPVYFLRQRVQTAPSWLADFDDEERIDYLLNKRSPVDRLAFADFPAESESDPEVLASARWDSPGRLLSYAYRSWLFCTFPHASNSLVKTDGTLWVVDYEKTLWRKDCGDIEELAKLVAPSARITAICRRMSAINSQHIEQAIGEIPQKLWETGESVLTSKGAALDYWCERADEWRLYFGVEQSA
ncbi:MAG: hypothetical protein V7641_2879 [Blastocatellia bacterium]